MSKLDDADRLLRDLDFPVTPQMTPAAIHETSRRAIEAFRNRTLDAAAAAAEVMPGDAAYHIRALKNEQPEPEPDEERKAAIAAVRNSLEHSIRRSAKASADEFQAALDAYNAHLDTAGNIHHAGEPHMATKVQPEPASKVEPILCKYCGQSMLGGKCRRMACPGEPASRVEQLEQAAEVLLEHADESNRAGEAAMGFRFASVAGSLRDEISKETS